MKVNFLNSKLVGINIEEDFLNSTLLFLSSSTKTIPFKFLGLLVGANQDTAPLRNQSWALRKEDYQVGIG